MAFDVKAADWHSGGSAQTNKHLDCLHIVAQELQARQYGIKYKTQQCKNYHTVPLLTPFTNSIQFVMKCGLVRVYAGRRVPFRIPLQVYPWVCCRLIPLICSPHKWFVQPDMRIFVREQPAFRQQAFFWSHAEKVCDMNWFVLACRRRRTPRSCEWPRVLAHFPLRKLGIYFRKVDTYLPQVTWTFAKAST
jgi:hypothetical protein